MGGSQCQLSGVFLCIELMFTAAFKDRLVLSSGQGGGDLQGGGVPRFAQNV